MSQTFRLFRLQQIDSQIEKVHSRLEEIENIFIQNYYSRTTSVITAKKLKVAFIEPPKEFWFVMGEYPPPPFGLLQLAAYLEAI